MRLNFARFVLKDYTLFATTHEPPVLVAIPESRNFFICTPFVGSGGAKEWSAVYSALEDSSYQLSPATEALLLRTAGR